MYEINQTSVVATAVLSLNLEKGSLDFKMISAEHSSNNGKNLVTKETSWHGNILNTLKKNLSRLKLSS